MFVVKLVEIAMISAPTSLDPDRSWIKVDIYIHAGKVKSFEKFATKEDDKCATLLRVQILLQVAPNNNIQMQK